MVLNVKTLQSRIWAAYGLWDRWRQVPLIGGLPFCKASFPLAASVTIVIVQFEPC